MSYLSRQKSLRARKRSAEPTLTSRGIELGKSEAENEHWSGEWFLDCFDWSENLQNGRYIFVGRKGTGKSAIVRHIREEQKKYPDEMSCRMIDDRDFQLESLLQHDYEHVDFLYEWLILVHLADCILKSPVGGESMPEYNRLRKFFDDNRGCVEITRRAVATVRKEASAGIDVKAFHCSASNSTDYGHAEYLSYIPHLREAVTAVLSSQLYQEHNIFLLFDNLDKDFSLANPLHKQRIIELVRVTKNYNTEYLRDTAARIILFLRDDVHRETAACSNDSAKIYSSAVYRMKWYDKSSSSINETDTNLRRFINMRIALVFAELGLSYDREDAWQSLVNEPAAKRKFHKSAFKYILDLTFYRPRDLLLFFKCLSYKNFPLPLSPDSIKECARAYLSESITELKSELAIIYGERDVRNYMGFLREFADEICASAKNGLSEGRVRELIASHHMAPEEFERMLSYWLIIPYISSDDKLFFPYREKELSMAKGKCTYKLPRSIFCYFHPESL